MQKSHARITILQNKKELFVRLANGDEAELNLNLNLWNVSV